MFKKKDVVKSSNDEIAARYVKKGGVLKDSASYENLPIRSLDHVPTSTKAASRYINENSIPANELSETYSLSKHHRQTVSAPNSTKGSRKIFPPFFSRKKKNQPSNRIYESTEDEEDDITEIACYDDLVAEQQSLNPVILGQLDDSQLNRIEVESFEKSYNARLEFILNNYRKPPPYPGKTREVKENNNTPPALKKEVDTPLIRQLLNDKQIYDNASMNNFWQVSPSHHAEQTKQTTENLNKTNDKLVDRTKDKVIRSKASELSNILNSGELYEKRRQYYIETLSNYEVPFNQCSDLHFSDHQDTISEIFPERDYDDIPVSKGGGLSASVPDLSQRPAMNQDRNQYHQQRANMEPGELEALIAHYRKTSLDTFEPYRENTTASESVSLYSEGSHSYVPPSPYLNAEIPEWLQVYAKASPDLDKYLKWEMFRYPELDCWQTMLKRLYKKELEQVVLWFEEYRHHLQEELKEYTTFGRVKKINSDRPDELISCGSSETN